MRVCISTLRGIVGFTGIRKMTLRGLEHVPATAVGKVLSAGGNRTLSSSLSPV